MKRCASCSRPMRRRRFQKNPLWLMVGVITASIASFAGLLADATPSQADPHAKASFMFQGRVYEGEVGDQSHPLEGVSVSLYGAGNPYPAPGVLITTTTTNSEGWYGLTADEGWEFYSIREDNPGGYDSVGATSVSGTIRTADWIEYVIPLDGLTLTGNKFWDSSGATPTPTDADADDDRYNPTDCDSDVGAYHDRDTATDIDSGPDLDYDPHTNAGQQRQSLCMCDS